jgi:hypothetical protein
VRRARVGVLLLPAPVPRARVCIINHQSYFSLKQIILSKQVGHHFRTNQYQLAAKQIGCRSLLGFPGGLALCLSACSFGWWLVLVCSERNILLAGCWWLICSDWWLISQTNSDCD